jgi:hypothetical protein
MYVCIHTYVSIYLSILPSIYYVSIYRSIYLSFYIYLSIYIYPPIANADGTGGMSLSPSLIVLDGTAQSDLSITQTAVIEHGRVHRRCFKVGARSSSRSRSAVEPLKATLTWTDPPGQPHSVLALVHNLDLALYRPAPNANTPDLLLYGNHHLARSPSEHEGEDAGGGSGDEQQDVTDVLNPTEQVVVADPVADAVYVIYVLGTTVVHSLGAPVEEEGAGGSVGAAARGSWRAGVPAQAYALAITAEKLEALSDTAPECVQVPCPRSCSGHGICAQGVCECNAAYWGVDCALRKRCPKGEGGLKCSGHGACVAHEAACVCEAAWSGPACQQYACASGRVTNVSVALNAGTQFLLVLLVQKYKYYKY